MAIGQTWSGKELLVWLRKKFDQTNLKKNPSPLKVTKSNKEGRKEGRSRGWEDNRHALFTICINIVVLKRTVVDSNFSTVLYINMFTVSSHVSVQGRHWQPISLYLWVCCIPTQPMIWMMCEGWPHHRGLCPLLFSNGGVGSFTSHMNKIIIVIAVRRYLRVFVFICED